MAFLRNPLTVKPVARASARYSFSAITVTDARLMVIVTRLLDPVYGNSRCPFKFVYYDSHGVARANDNSRETIHR